MHSSRIYSPGNRLSAWTILCAPVPPRRNVFSTRGQVLQWLAGVPDGPIFHERENRHHSVLSQNTLMPTGAPVTCSAAASPIAREAPRRVRRTERQRSTVSSSLARDQRKRARDQAKTCRLGEFIIHGHIRVPDDDGHCAQHIVARAAVGDERLERRAVLLVARGILCARRVVTDASSRFSLQRRLRRR